MTDAPDCQLLHRFARHRDEAAFAALVRRHGPRVRGVCRRVLRDEHDAEDVAQATFLVLANKAAHLPAGPTVGPWLSAVAHRLALKARALRRGGREPRTGRLDGEDPADHRPGPDPLADAARREVCGLVREELARLPEKYRTPVVLCYLEGKTNEQAARELGWPSGSMARRLDKARRLLRENLTGRGLVLLAALLCLGLVPLGLGRLPSRSGPPACVGSARPEEVLRRAAGGSPAVERDQLLALARDARRAADRLADHAPGRPDAWRGAVLALAGSARDLAGAADADDRPGTRRAAAQLYAACARCHPTFRD